MKLLLPVAQFLVAKVPASTELT